MQMSMESGKKRKILGTREIALVGVFAAISYVLMFISTPVPGIFPEFLKLTGSCSPLLTLSEARILKVFARITQYVYVHSLVELRLQLDLSYFLCFGGTLQSPYIHT